jgi:hypothetical protein
MHRDAGVDLHTIKRWLRHSSLEQTVQYLADNEDQSPQVRSLVKSTFSAIESTKRTGSLSLGSKPSQERFGHDHDRGEADDDGLSSAATVQW